MSGPPKTLVIFVRAPQYGAVKSRLAEAVGPGAALRAYREMTWRVLSAATSRGQWTTILQVTPGDLSCGRWWPASLQRAGQSRGDLGQRMASALARYSSRGPVALVGSDIPDLRRDDLRQAFDALGSQDLAFGPAQDGGYWLVGVRQGLPIGAIRRMFNGVRWSSAHALSDTLRNVRPGLRVAELRTACDVDTIDDLEAWRRRQTA